MRKKLNAAGMPLEDKILAKRLVDEAVSVRLGTCLISYSGGKDSTVLSHLIQRNTDILHILNTRANIPRLCSM